MIFLITQMVENLYSARPASDIGCSGFYKFRNEFLNKGNQMVVVSVIPFRNWAVKMKVLT